MNNFSQHHAHALPIAVSDGDGYRLAMLTSRASIEAYVDALIARLDDLDGDTDLEPEESDQDAGDQGEPDEDGEPSLGFAEGAQHASGGGHDEEEPDLGWCNNVGQLRLGEGHHDGDETALERHGAGFVRSGGDDSEDSHDAEAVNEDGSDTGSSDNGIGDLGGASEVFYGVDSDGEVSGGDTLGADRPTVCLGSEDGTAWVRA